MTSIEAFALKGEKNMLKNMFKEDGASSDDSMSDCDEDERYKLSIKEIMESRVNPAKENDSILENAIATGNSLTENGFSGDNSFLNDLHHPAIFSIDSSESETTIELYHSCTESFVISLQQQKLKGIAHQLWPAATHLSKYIEENLHTLYAHSKPEDTGILELGAGIGLCGLVCSALKFKKVILTDLPVALDLLNANIAINNFCPDEAYSSSAKTNPESETPGTALLISSSDNDITCPRSSTHSTSVTTLHLPNTANKAYVTEAQVLSWGNHEELVAAMNRFDKNCRVLVIAADCVYWEILFKPLYLTIQQLTSVYNAEVIISHVRRWKKDEKFFKMCRKTMTVELLEEIRELVPAPHTGIPTREIKRIYRIKAK